MIASPPVRRTVSDAGVVAVASAAVAGALWARPAPVWAAVVVAVVGVLAVRPIVLAAAVLALASGLGADAHAGLDGLRSEVLDGEVVTLRTDPEWFGSVVRADVHQGGRRLELQVRGSVRRRLAPLAVGDRVSVSGVVRPPRPQDRRWFRPRHVAGRLQADEVAAHAPADGPLGVANSVRSALADGVDHLGVHDRAMFLGLVVGDDRRQSDADRDDFRAAGLTHLLAVSGQNVAFLLALAAPLLRRLPFGPRLAAVGVLLGLFLLVTRWEPSVVRATLMAFLAVVSQVTGRPVSRLRLLAWAVLAMVLIDPLLVHSVGFRLSVVATLGILALAEPIAARLPGPSGLREALAVTMAAQVGVAPVQLGTFDDGLPLAAVPANLLAGPVAGFVMAWGMTAGLVAGAVGGPLAVALHVPTEAAVWWLRGVASTAADAPLPTVG